MPHERSLATSLRRILRCGLLAAVAGLGVRAWWVHETRSPLRSPDAPPGVLVVPAGSSAEAVGRLLREQGLVRHPLAFRALVLLKGVGGRLKAGEYALEGPLTLEQLVDLVARGQVVRREVTVPEGKNLVEIAEIFEDHGVDMQAFLAAAHEPASIRDLDPHASDLEGYLFPDTYDLPRTPASASALVARMVRRFRDVVTPELPRFPARGLTVRQAVTMASLVELETAQAEERPRIAAVFFNRLRRGMLLQTDPTVIYALRLAGRWDGNIRKRDLSLDSPYNTYRYPGLPPGPIASPGREAILA
ncbi:MAG TPA: endolytic transglycosylase MltG, partial [Vicinamibacteria bacterium]|nr:endolytic transglycosylase MltG [Vicinamibacteria bacterium]